MLQAANWMRSPGEQVCRENRGPRGQHRGHSDLDKSSSSGPLRVNLPIGEQEERSKEKSVHYLDGGKWSQGRSFCTSPFLFFL